ncbi:MAG: CoA-binding protein [Myxococcota bacterium]
MAHPLEDIIRHAEGFVLIGDSSEGRFPGFSYSVYTKLGKRFYCLDLGGLPVSRGPTKGGRVYHAVAELPDDRDDLAIVWVRPKTAVRAVELAHEAGCRRIWFSFQTGHPQAVERARVLGLQVLEIGRCPVYYLADKPTPCRLHTLMVRASGAYARPPQTDPSASRRELI